MRRVSKNRRGSAARTAMGLLALGAASALFGALILGPTLGDRLAPQLQPTGAQVARVPEPDPGFEPLPSPRPTLKPSAARPPAPDVEPVEVDVRDAGSRPEEDEPDAYKPHRDPVETAPDEVVLPKPVRKPRPAVKPEPVAKPEPEPEPEVKPEPEPARPVVRVSPAKRNRKPVQVAVTTPAGSSPEEEGDPEESATIYRVRLGRFKDRAEAEKVCAEVTATGVTTASLVIVDGEYRVQAGAYGRKKNARKLADELRGRRYRPEITEAKRDKAASDES